jgi:hypothetical protein
LDKLRVRVLGSSLVKGTHLGCQVWHEGKTDLWKKEKPANKVLIISRRNAAMNEALLLTAGLQRGEYLLKVRANRSKNAGSPRRNRGGPVKKEFGFNEKIGGIGHCPLYVIKID